MQRRGKHSRDEEEEAQLQQATRARTAAVANASTNVEDDEDDWENESSSEDGAIVEDGLGPLDDEEIIEDDDEDEDEDYASFQKESNEALGQNLKTVTFDEAALQAQAEAEEAAAAASIWRSDRPEAEEEGMDCGPLEYSNKAYDSFFQLRTEYPFLSFDIVKDLDGSNRTKYPLSMLLVCGSQADAADRNHLALLRIHNVCRTKHDVMSDDDSEDSFIGGDQEEPSGEDENDEEAEEVNDGEPIVEHRLIKHHGSANRVRVSPFATFGASQYVAVWSDAGHVQVFDMDYECRALVDFANWSKEEAHKWKDSAKKKEGSSSGQTALRFCTPSSTHRTEGYGLGWSTLRNNVFASGDCDGALYVWQPTDDGRWKHVASSAPASEAMSIEEITWSPTQPDVLLTARAGGMVEVWDTRDMRGPKRSWRADPTDINVADWNKTKQASHLLVTGAESGAVGVWDLRKLGSSSSETTVPIQNLVWHKKRISSVEFSLHNESVLAVTSDDGQCTLWDLSLERDPSEEQEMVGELFGRPDLTGIPDPLMFQHQGLVAPKEAHWHSQIPGMVVTTDYNGLHLFKPMNWRSLMK